MNKVFLLLATLMVSGSAFAQTAEESARAALNTAVATNHAGLVALAAGLAIGLAAIGGALGQARTAAAALEGIARNPAAQPKIFTPMIIGLALIESLVIYAFVIAFLLQTKF